MRSITQTKRQKRNGLRLFEARAEKADISEQRIEWSINYSYTAKRLWSGYLNLYFDLFTDEATAQFKARTHSVAVMCMIMRNRYGCSFPRIYKALLREISKSDMHLHEGIINIKTKWDFIDCLHELSRSTQ